MITSRIAIDVEVRQGTPVSRGRRTDVDLLPLAHAAAAVSGAEPAR
jgi:hypothetical protein